MANETYSNQVQVEINGAPLDRDLKGMLGASWVESSVNQPAAFHLSFRGRPKQLMEKYGILLRIGAKVAVYGLADQQKGPPLITGYATGLEIDYENANPVIVLRGVDHAFRMLRQRRATGYRNKTASAIVAWLAGKDEVEIGEIEPTTTQYELLTQPNISDWQLVQHLAEQNEMQASFDNQGKLQFRKGTPAGVGSVTGATSASPYRLDLLQNVLSCRAGATASDQVSEVTTRGWDQQYKKQLTGHAFAATNPGLPKDMSPGQVVAEFGSAVLTDTGTPYGSQAEADHAAAALGADVTASFGELEIEVRGDPMLKPGSVVTLSNAGTPFDGSYTVSTTRHTFGTGNEYRTWVWVTGRQVRNLYGLAAGASQPAPRIYGVVNAVVTDIQDPDNQGRVKVRFPWFDDTYYTEWARTVQFGGDKGGGVISPEVDDEVLVAFDRGVIDYPYVLGGLYSLRNPPSPHEVPVQSRGRLNRKSLVSRTGQRVELLDSIAPKLNGVRLQSGDKGLTIFLDQTKSSVTINSNGSVDIRAPRVNVIAAENLSLRSPTVSVTGEVSVTGGLSVTGPLVSDVAASFGGAVSIGGNLAVAGMANVLGDLMQNFLQVVTLPA